MKTKLLESRNMSWLFTKKPEARTLGQIGEEFAQRYYEQLGFTIVAKNEYNKKGKQLGEIDFIAKNKEQIVFVEVKTRQRPEGRFGSGEEAVNGFKQAKILKAVKIFLLKHAEYAAHSPRIDVCVVLAGSLAGLRQISVSPPKYVLDTLLDKLPFSVKLVVNAVEDWG